jgi:hypothetical protein
VNDPDNYKGYPDGFKWEPNLSPMIIEGTEMVQDDDWAHNSDVQNIESLARALHDISPLPGVGQAFSDISRALQIIAKRVHSREESRKAGSVDA